MKFCFEDVSGLTSTISSTFPTRGDVLDCCLLFGWLSETSSIIGFEELGVIQTKFVLGECFVQGEC